MAFVKQMHREMDEEVMKKHIQLYVMILQSTLDWVEEKPL